MKKIILGAISLFCLCSILFLSGCNKEYEYIEVIVDGKKYISLDCKRDSNTIFTYCSVDSTDAVYCSDIKVDDKNGVIKIINPLTITGKGEKYYTYTVEWNEIDEIIIKSDNFIVYKNKFVI